MKDSVKTSVEADQVRMTTLIIVKNVVSRSTRNESGQDTNVPTSISTNLGVARLGNVKAGLTMKSRKKGTRTSKPVCKKDKDHVRSSHALVKKRGTHDSSESFGADDRRTTEKYVRKERSDSSSDSESSRSSSATCMETLDRLGRIWTRVRRALRRMTRRIRARRAHRTRKMRVRTKRMPRRREKFQKAVEDAIKDLREQIARLSAASPDVQQAVVMQPGYVPGMMMPMMNRAWRCSGGASPRRAPTSNLVPHDRPVVCYGCGQPGHIRSRCPAGRTQSNNGGGNGSRQGFYAKRVRRRRRRRSGAGSKHYLEVEDQWRQTVGRPGYGM